MTYGFHHLNQYNIGYFPHMWRALKFGVKCVFWAGEVFLHAIHPDSFTDTSVRMKQEIEELEKSD